MSWKPLTFGNIFDAMKCHDGVPQKIESMGRATADAIGDILDYESFAKELSINGHDVNTYGNTSRINDEVETESGKTLIKVVDFEIKPNNDELNATFIIEKDTENIYKNIVTQVIEDKST